ncbi:MAG TPA: tetratricopeptide repeat protein [Sedimentisphaerales bacterium]
MTHYQKSLEIEPGNSSIQANLGSALLMKGQLDEAIAHYKASLAIKPDDAGVQASLGNALFKKRQLNEAILHYRKSLEINPDNTYLLNILARILAASPDPSIRNGAKAVELAQRANQLSGGSNPRIITTLAAAEAEAGQFPEAVGIAQQALELATAQSNTALIKILQIQIGLYQANLPFRDPSLTNVTPDQERSK